MTVFVQDDIVDNAGQLLPARGSANLYWLISPYGLAFFSLLPLAVSLLISRDVYERFADESCLMCGSIWMPIFCLLCTLSFMLGAAISQAFNNKNAEAISIATPATKRAELIFVGLGLVVLALLNVASFLIMLSNTSGLLSLLLSGGGAVAKEAINTEGSFSQVQPVLIYYNAYALARYCSSRHYLLNSERQIFSALLILSIFLTILIAIAKVARYEMMPVICSLAFVVSEHKARTSRIGNLTLICYLIAALALVVGVFAFFSIFRGFAGVDEIVGTLIGYGPAPYNHLVSILDAEFKPTYAGTGLYAFPFLGHIPLFESIFHLTEILGLPTAEATFLAEFTDTERAGLNRMYIWLTMYGYVYADLGMGTLVFMLVYGYIANSLFEDYGRGGAVGAFMYPMIFVAMILTFSFNILLRPSTVAVVVIAFVVSKVERVIREIGLRTLN